MSQHSEEEADVNEPQEIRVGWVYRLHRDELMAELQRLRLNDEGTVEDLRRRLVAYLRDIPPRQAPAPVPPVAAVEIPVTPMDFTVADQLRKLNLKFNGKTNAVDFLERLEQVKEDFDITDEQLVKTLPVLFQERAYQWFLNYRHHWADYYDFLEDFKTFFFPPDYRDSLEDEINRKLQTKQESASDFILDMQTLVRRHGGYSTERAITTIYKKLRPEYRQYIRRSTVRTIAKLLQETYEFERLQTELKNTQYIKTGASTTGTSIASNTRQGITNRPQINPGNSRGGMETRHNSPNSDILCWRCGATGHTRFNCRRPPRLFCSRCGREGVQSRDCPCRNPSTSSQGNEPGPGSLRGESSGRH